MTGVWYDELAGMLSDVGAKVELMKKFSGDLSYVIVGDLEVNYSSMSGSFIVSQNGEDVAAVWKLETAANVVRRTLENTLTEV